MKNTKLTVVYFNDVTLETGCLNFAVVRKVNPHESIQSNKTA